jgi:hypothetical protein
MSLTACGLQNAIPATKSAMLNRSALKLALPFGAPARLKTPSGNQMTVGNCFDQHRRAGLPDHG